MQKRCAGFHQIARLSLVFVCVAKSLAQLVTFPRIAVVETEYCEMTLIQIVYAMEFNSIEFSSRAVTSCTAYSHEGLLSGR